jgi:glucosamine--fructose-6-phosphate aminotransferase (isomerizing)
MDENTYLQDILSQPAALRTALDRFDLEPLKPYIRALRNGEYDRLILTGMGASGYAAYPAWLQLLEAGFPAFWVDSAELSHYAQRLITRRSLVWLISQSGRSAEILRLIDLMQATPPAALITTTNDLASPLAQAAGLTLPLEAAVEETVSTRTYLNSLAISQLVARALFSEDLDSHYYDLRKTADGIASYLANWGEHLLTLEGLIGMPRHLLLVGRGPSMAAVLTGALIIGEAAKFPALGLNAAQFRHGPLEMVGSQLTVLVYGGLDETDALNRHLLHELLGFGTAAFWLSPSPQGELSALTMPQASGIGLPLAEIVPIQLLSVHLARQMGVVPGKFLYSGKVTLTE